MSIDQPDPLEGPPVIPPGAETSPEVRFPTLQGGAKALFAGFQEKMEKAPTLNTLVPFLIDSDGLAQLQKYFEELAAAAKGMPNPPVSVTAFEKAAGDIKLWGDNLLSKLQGNELLDDPTILKNLAAGLGSVFDVFPTEPPVSTPEPQPKLLVPESVPQPPPTPRPPEPVLAPVAGTPPAPELTPAPATTEAVSPDAPPTPEHLAASVHAERTSQEQLIADFETKKSASANEAVTKGIELIGKLRESLGRQAAVAGDEIAPLARDENQKLETLLGRIAQIRGKRQKMSQKQLVDSLREILNFENEPADTVKQRKHDVGEADLESTGPAAPVVPGVAKAPEKLTRVASPEASVTKPILEAPTFDIGKAMDVAGFMKFLAEAGNPGENEDAVKKHFEAFALKDTVAGKVAQLYNEKIFGERGISLGDEGVAAVKEHLELQARQNPEAIKELAGKFERFETLTAEVKALNDQLEPLRREVENAKTAEEGKTAERTVLQQKFEMLALAEKTNRFWPTWRTFTRDMRGLGWLSGVVSKRAREARGVALREMKLGSRRIEALFTFGAGLNTHKLLAEQARVSSALRAVVAALAAGEARKQQLELIKNSKTQSEQLFTAAKDTLVLDLDLTNTLIAITNKKLNEKLTEVQEKGAGADLDEAERVFGLFEKAEKAYRGNPSAAHLKDVNPADGMKAIDAVIEASIGRQIEQAFAEAETLTSGKFSALENVLEGFVAKVKLGKRDKLAIRRFIILVLNKELDDLGTTEKTVSPKAILIKTLIARQMKKIKEENPHPLPPPPPPPAPPTPTAVPPASPVAPLSAPSAPSSPEASPATSPTVPLTSETVPSSHAAPPPVDNVKWVASEYLPQTSEETEKMTFSDVMKSDSSILKEVVHIIPADDLASILSEETRDIVDRVHTVLTAEEREVFDGLLDRRKREINSGVAEEIFKKRVENLKKKVVEIAKSVFTMKKRKRATLLTSSSASAPEVRRINITEISSRESEGAVPINKREKLPGPTGGGEETLSLSPEQLRSLTFEELPRLNDNDLRLIIVNSVTTPFGWGLNMNNMSNEFIQRIRACFQDDSNKISNFERGVMVTSGESPEALKKAREWAVENAKEKIFRENLLKPDSSLP